MKKIVLTLLCACFSISYAQITTPGNGSLFTFSYFVDDPSGAVTTPEAGVYLLSQDLTISQNDTLLLDASIQNLQIEGDVTITVNGTLLCSSRDNQLEINGIENDSTDLFEWRFEEAASSVLSNLKFEYGESIFISQSPILIENCEFSHFSSQVIRFMNCNPIIRDCNFHDNQMAAINSAVNVQGSPIIRNNTFYHNVLSNANQPQINLGPGIDSSVILIEGNTIEGCSSMSGGIAIANLMNVGSTRAVLRNNTIENNRYGYTQQGSNILALIEDNLFINNNLETNPMNGGSGISIYGSDTTCIAKLRRNTISGNLWGITAINYHKIDMGTATDYGNNSLYNNENGGTTYALYNNAVSSITAIGNYWGGDTEEFAESVIYHRPDLGESYGRVLFSPILTEEPVSITDNHDFDISLYPNPSNDFIQIQLSESTSPLFTVFQLYDLSGRLIQVVPATGTQTQIGVTNYPSGIYLLKVVNDSKIVAVKKIVKR